MPVGFEIEGQDLEEIYVKWSEVPYYEGILDFSSTVPGGMWSWGNNNMGVLGLGDVVHRSSPVQVGSLSDWARVSLGLVHTAAIKTDGTLWTWGQSFAGNLGVPGLVNRSSPVRVGALQDWDQLSTGGYHNVAVKSDGSLWSWGYNAYGNLGLGNITDRSSPVRVGALNDWSRVSCGYHHTIAVKTDGSLWSWGYNHTGQLGLGNGIRRSSPVQIGSLTDWKYVSVGAHSNGAIKTDGSLWVWGWNAYGVLGVGQGAVFGFSSPIQVGSLKNWAFVSMGYTHSAAIKTDGTLWTWGTNNFGELGNGVTSGSSISSPIQVGSLTDWKSVQVGYQFTTALKTDGSLWAWGKNATGQLGTENITDYSSPVRVGALTSWNKFASGFVSDGRLLVIAIQY